MKKEYPRYTLRIPKSMLKKIAYIADFNGRTTNKQIEILIRKKVDEHERCYGLIEFEKEIDEKED
jgi:hypothetical protein